jgi:hypothetical protein
MENNFRKLESIKGLDARILEVDVSTYIYKCMCMYIYVYVLCIFICTEYVYESIIIFLLETNGVTHTCVYIHINKQMYLCILIHINPLSYHRRFPHNYYSYRNKQGNSIGKCRIYWKSNHKPPPHTHLLLLLLLLNEKTTHIIGHNKQRHNRLHIHPLRLVSYTYEVLCIYECISLLFAHTYWYFYNNINHISSPNNLFSHNLSNLSSVSIYFRLGISQ